jgi:tripartite-type tricarboxylate transporter receptor subunit TctC
MNRREVLKAGVGTLAAATGGWSVTGRSAAAAEWPTQAVRIIVPYGPGSATDLAPRIVFETVANDLGQTFIIENRPGGGTTIGTNAVAKAAPDGATILVASNALVTVPAILAHVPYDPSRDFAGIAPLGNVPLVLVTAPSKGIKTVQELVAAAKAKPGTINYAAAGIGTPPHLGTERFRLAANFDGQLVPFKSAPEAVTEVIAGRVDFYFCPIAAALPLVQEGKLVALAIGSSKRAVALPDVPTTLEAGYANSNLDFWIGALAPKKTPRDIVAKMHAAVTKALDNPDVRAKLAKQGIEPMPMTSEAFDERIARETREAVELTKAAHIAPQ